MELDSHGDRFLNYFYYILGSLPNADESMELGSQRARSGFNYYYIRGSLPNSDDSMELCRCVTTVIFYAVYLASTNYFSRFRNNL